MEEELEPSSSRALASGNSIAELLLTAAVVGG